MLKNRRHFFLFFTEIVFIRPLQTLSSIPTIDQTNEMFALHTQIAILFFIFII